MKHFQLLSFLLFLFFCPLLSGQNIVFTTPCNDANFCLSQGSCTEGNAAMNANAEGGCSALNYSYKIDINSDNVIDINGNGQSASGTFPKGNHRITWRANDFCGNVAQCTYQFVIKDCNPPNLLCINGLTQSIDPPDCQVSFSANQFILNLNDNCTPLSQIEIGMRVTGSGTGFPVGSTAYFDECDTGPNFLDIWVRDENGLVNSCQTYVLVQNSSQDCICDPDGDLMLKGCVRQPDGSTLQNYLLKANLESLPGLQPPVVKNFQKTETDSCYSETFNHLPYGGSYQGSVFASRNTLFSEGVSTLDLLFINRHIIGQQPFTSVYQALAADANRSGTLTTFDVVELRKVILGIYDTLPLAPNWYFVQPFAEPDSVKNWLNAPISYPISLQNLQRDTTLSNLQFVAVKAGDVNFSVQMGQEGDDRSEPVWVTSKNSLLKKGQPIDISLELSEADLPSGWQMELEWDSEKISLENARSEWPNFEQNRLGDHLWRALAFGTAPNGRVLATFSIIPLVNCRLEDALRTPSGSRFSATYDAQELAHPLVFRTAPAVEGLSVLAPVPNPAHEKVLFPVYSDTEESAVLEIYDISGKLVAQNKRLIPAGYVPWEISVTDLPPNALYFYQIQLGTAFFTGKILKR